MERIPLSEDRAEPVERFDSAGVSQVPIGDGEGEAHVYLLRFEPGGRIGPHVAGYGQFFLVVSGSGWAAGEDGRPLPLAQGEGVFFARGESHSKGSDAGMTAVMIQVRDSSPCRGRP
jgi:quercetin dioxygenase-like cupin family protein